MTDIAPATPNKRGPNTPEGNAHSRMNALKHGLRAREFGLLPEEDQAEWGQHVRDLEKGYGPEDATEKKLWPRSPPRCGTRSAPTGWRPRC